MKGEYFIAIDIVKLQQLTEDDEEVKVTMASGEEFTGKFKHPIKTGEFKTSSGQKMILNIDKISFVKIIEDD